MVFVPGTRYSVIGVSKEVRLEREGGRLVGVICEDESKGVGSWEAYLGIERAS